jgi:four helix bundle protein
MAWNTDNIIKRKSLQFALEIIKIWRLLQEENKEYILSRQILRSWTSIWANIAESEHAESKPDFIHKMNIALKEANETEYWLELLYQSKYINDDVYLSLKNPLIEILKILTSIIKSSKTNQK